MHKRFAAAAYFFEANSQQPTDKISLSLSLPLSLSLSLSVCVCKKVCYLLVVAQLIAEHLGERNQGHVPDHAEERVKLNLRVR